MNNVLKRLGLGLALVSAISAAGRASERGEAKVRERTVPSIDNRRTIAPSPFGDHAIDADVWFVQSGGAWTQLKTNGHYRTIIYKRCSPEHCYDTLQLQWIAELTNGDRIAASVNIAEIGDLTIVSRAELIPSQTGTHLEVSHETLHAEERWTRCFLLGPPVQYTASLGRC
jgi:hypothetical protein